MDAHSVADIEEPAVNDSNGTNYFQDYFYQDYKFFVSPTYINADSSIGQ